MHKFFKLVLAVICFAFVISTAAYASDAAAAKLAAGKTLFNQGKYDAAMDNFIEVFVSGNSQQIAEANEYVNLIHFAIGGVDAPKKAVYEPLLEQSSQAPVPQPPATVTAPPVITAPPAANAPTPAPAATAEAAPQAAAAYAPYYEEYYTAPQTSAAADQQPQESQQQLPPAPQELSAGTETIIAESEMPSASPEELRELRRQATDAHIIYMTKGLVERLNKQNGVTVYMRGGMVDAIDVQPNILFDKSNNFNLSAKPVLDDIYALMLLSGTPTFALLPYGAYTDEVSITSVKQVIALNSYFINMGLSSGKISFSMGLNNEPPPAKFANLDGIGIVFDYTTQPTLKRKLNEPNTPPVLSMGMYPFASFTPAKNEGMLIDFSVIEASSPVADWSLQIIYAGKDGKYYIARQVSGMGAVYKQIFWNGKKQYFGEILPIGTYTLVLRAKDIDGREKIVRRKVTLNDVPKPPAPKAAATAAATTAVKQSAASYKDKRLWTKPARYQKEGAVIEAPAASQASSATAAPQEEYNPYAPVPAMDNTPSQYQYAAPAPTAPAQGGGYNTVNMPYPSQMPDEGGRPEYDY